MPLKIKIVKMLIKWLWNHYQYLLREQVIPAKYHLHRNPVKQAPVTGE